jgi:hypothetical protein
LSSPETLAEQSKPDLTRCADDILLARVAHFPATIADVYYPDAMPARSRKANTVSEVVRHESQRMRRDRRFAASREPEFNRPLAGHAGYMTLEVSREDAKTQRKSVA